MGTNGLLRRIRTGRAFGEARLAVLLFLLLLIVNFILNPARFAPSALGTTLGLVAPLILAAVAVTPVILSGGGAIDISIGPLMTLINVIIVQVVLTEWGQTSPLVVVPIALSLGILSGLLNGFLAVVIRLQPIVATFWSSITLRTRGDHHEDRRVRLDHQ